MTILVTRNTPARFGGFLCSCMLEVAPGVFVGPRLNKAVRERIWAVMLEWAEQIPSDGGVVMFWKSREAPLGLGIRTLGWPKKEILDLEGLWLSRRDLTEAHHQEELKALLLAEEAHPDSTDPTLQSGLEQDE